MKLKNLRNLFLFLLFSMTAANANDYIIYSIVQNIPMDSTDTPKKNYYINMGEKQGIRPGTVLDVVRSINRSAPYESKKRYNYKVKIGELKVIHAEANAAIGSINKIRNEEKDPLFEIEKLMIGDKVTVKVSD
ncbi:MAG: hypothetical protein GY909_12355 [Oligoflexia bacterium]|nr:hypothetical protein [Oligoflexia bacterium]